MVFENVDDIVIVERRGIFVDPPENLKRIAIVPVQARHRAEPHKSPGVLMNAGGLVMR